MTILRKTKWVARTATAPLLAACLLGATIGNALAANFNVQTEATIATQLSVTQQQTVNGGLWASGDAPTNWTMTSAGVVTVNSGNYTYIAGGTPGQLTITGTPNAQVIVFHGSNVIDPSGNLQIDSLLLSGDGQTDVNGASGLTASLDGTGALVLTVGVNAAWAAVNTPEGAYQADMPITVSYQ